MPEAVDHRQVLVLVLVLVLAPELALATTGLCAVADRLIDAGR
ncbi:MAG TPA: hypothetical protein VFU95_06750 [Telluria sp.]|nr:hypothetical protein [Telluria sp.]